MKKKKIVSLAVLSLIAPTILNTHVVVAEVMNEESGVIEESRKTDTLSEEVNIDESETSNNTSLDEKESVVPQESEESIATSETEHQTEDKDFPTEEATESLPEQEQNIPETNNNESTFDIGGELGPELSEPGAPLLWVPPLRTVPFRSAFNPMEGVNAYDEKDGDLTNKVKVTGEVNTSIPTIDKPYFLHYSVTNSAGKTTETIVAVIVEEENVGFLSVSIPDFTLPNGADFLTEIQERIIVKDPYNEIAPKDSYLIYLNGFNINEQTGVYQVSVIVESLEWGTITQTTANIKVVSGVTLNVPAEREIPVSLTSNEFDYYTDVTATEMLPNGSTVSLGKYNPSTDTGISVWGEVDTTKVGEYTLTYIAKNSLGATDVKTMIVKVIADKTIIHAEDKVIEQGMPFDPTNGVSASNSNGEVPFEVLSNDVNVNVPGTYHVTYGATNPDGTPSTKTITVTVQARYTVISATNHEVIVGTDVTEEMIKNWATAKDSVDQDLTSQITYEVVNGPINTDTAGNQYDIVYTVTNSAGNISTKTITLTVVAEKETDDNEEDGGNNTGTDTNTNNNNSENQPEKETQKEVKKEEKKDLPKTGETTSILTSILGVITLGLFYVIKKRKNDTLA